MPTTVRSQKTMAERMLSPIAEVRRDEVASAPLSGR
jgi:hypothetical protein